MLEFDIVRYEEKIGRFAVDAEQPDERGELHVFPAALVAPVRAMVDGKTDEKGIPMTPHSVTACGVITALEEWGCSVPGSDALVIAPDEDDPELGHAAPPQEDGAMRIYTDRNGRRYRLVDADEHGELPPGKVYLD